MITIKATALRHCLTVGMLFMQASVNADGIKPFQDWVVNVKTEELQRQFDYDRSGLRKVAKVTVEYFHESDKDDIKPYQRLYYSAGKPIGMERSGDLNLPPAQTVAIRVAGKKEQGIEERRATANVLWRLSLNIGHKKASLISATVPEASFDDIEQELQRLGFSEARERADQSAKAKALIGLESEPAGKNASLYYY